MRVAAPEFGPFALMLMRCCIGAAVLLPICAVRGKFNHLVRAWQSIGLIGLINSGLPFALFGYAALVLPAGMIAVLNSTAPFFGVLIAYLWLKERLSVWQALGLAVGFTGVMVLVLSGGKLEVADTQGLLLGAGAALLAAASYGLAASVMKRYLLGVDSLAGASGSQLSASFFLLLPGIYFWPEHSPSLQSWLAVMVLGVFSTALAYLLYFRLITNLGPSRAITVTFAIPAFGLFWGAIALGEAVSLLMLMGALLVVLGCMFTTGVWPRKA